MSVDTQQGSNYVEPLLGSQAEKAVAVIDYVMDCPPEKMTASSQAIAAETDYSAKEIGNGLMPRFETLYDLDRDKYRLSENDRTTWNIQLLQEQEHPSLQELRNELEQ